MMREDLPVPELSNSLEDYLEAIRNIERQKDCASVGEIAAEMGVKKSSVSLAMRQLNEMGFIEHKQYMPVVLTPTGRELADQIIACHLILREFLTVVLKMDEPRANEVACRIEHLMSLEEISRFQRLTDRVKNKS